MILAMQCVNPKKYRGYSKLKVSAVVFTIHSNTTIATMLWIEVLTKQDFVYGFVATIASVSSFRL